MRILRPYRLGAFRDGSPRNERQKPARTEVHAGFGEVSIHAERIPEDNLVVTAMAVTLESVSKTVMVLIVTTMTVADVTLSVGTMTVVAGVAVSMKTSVEVGNAIPAMTLMETMAVAMTAKRKRE